MGLFIVDLSSSTLNYELFFSRVATCNLRAMVRPFLDRLLLFEVQAQHAETHLLWHPAIFDRETVGKNGASFTGGDEFRHSDRPADPVGIGGWL